MRKKSKNNFLVSIITSPFKLVHTETSLLSHIHFFEINILKVEMKEKLTNKFLVSIKTNPFKLVHTKTFFLSYIHFTIKLLYTSTISFYK